MRKINFSELRYGLINIFLYEDKIIILRKIITVIERHNPDLTSGHYTLIQDVTKQNLLSRYTFNSNPTENKI